MNIKIKLRRLSLAVFFILFSCPLASYAKVGLSKLSFDNYSFVVPTELESRVNFWKEIYTSYDTNQAIIHDQNNLAVIYEVVDLPSNFSQRRTDKRLERIKRKYRIILRNLAKKISRKSKILSSDEKRLRNIVKGNYYKASRNLRIQIGQRSRFRAGLKMSGRYINDIHRIFSEYRLPLALTVLPHVESSFQLNAYSSAGAAGIWQFTRSTGRRFLKIGYDVDERLDPIFSTKAAAQLLKYNYQALKSWPLAITAYNHGLQGVKRAKRRYGNDIVKIIRNYRSRTFGFASQNFYSEFLAALEIIRDKNRYFPSIVMDPPIKNMSVVFQDYLNIKTIMDYFRMSRKEIQQYNPSLRRPVINGNKRVPRGFVFQVPANKGLKVQAIYSQIPFRKKYRSQIASKWYRVQRGDTLSEVARRFRTKVSTLKQLNHIGRRNIIYLGQVLQLPGRYTKSYKIGNTKPNFSSYWKSGNLIYKVKRNDNLTKIASRYKMDPLVLAAYNHFKNPDNLYPGQIIKIPKKSKKTTSSLKVVKKPDGFLVKSKLKKQKTKSANIKYYLKGDKPRQTNSVRPAFLPVVFDSKSNHPIKIGTIIVDFDETLSHYADWANLSLKEIRRINRYHRNQPIHVNRKIKVPFSRVTPEVFEEKREEYHKAIQEDFFNNYEITKTILRKVKKGETIWDICNNIYSIPFWLLNMYNPNQDINSLDVGESIVIPIFTYKSF